MVKQPYNTDADALVPTFQEDVNGEKLTVKKWWIFGADFFTVWRRFFHGLRPIFSRFVSINRPFLVKDVLLTHK